MLIIGFSGYHINEESPVVTWLKRDGLGGVLLFDFDLPANQFGKNLQDKVQIKQLTDDLRRFSLGSCLPLFIALDYEGGAVDRLSKISGCMKTMKASDQALLSHDAFHNEVCQMADTLKELGFNLNFAPVVDLNLNDQEGIIGALGRSFSNDSDTVVRAAKEFVHIFHAKNIVCSYKHFPGHGSAVGDTHEGFVDVSETYQNKELLPYRELFKESHWPVMVMTAHVINRQLDPTGLPATLSFTVLTQLLRHQLGFKGVIVSDDLQMQAISDHYSIDDALRLTLNAGADMVIFGNQLGSITPSEVIDRIEQLVLSGAVDVSRIDDAYQRISQLKATIA